MALKEDTLNYFECSEYSEIHATESNEPTCMWHTEYGKLF